MLRVGDSLEELGPSSLTELYVIPGAFLWVRETDKEVSRGFDDQAGVSSILNRAGVEVVFFEFKELIGVLELNILDLEVFVGDVEGAWTLLFWLS